MELTSPTTSKDLIKSLHQEAFSPEHAKACEEVYSALSQINVNEHTEEKNGLTYLSWAWAYSTVMEHFPTFDYFFHPTDFHNDGTATVQCTVWIIHKGHLVAKHMWLPVMNHANKAIISPNSVDLNKNKMRCLTKAISMLGLGAYIYAGEDLPASGPTKDDNMNSKVAESEQEKEPAKAAKKKVTKKKVSKKTATKKDTEAIEEAPLLVELREGQKIEIPDEESAIEIADLLIKFAEKSKTESDLIGFYRKNAKVFDYFDTHWNEQYVRIQAKFSEFRKKLKEGK